MDMKEQSKCNNVYKNYIYNNFNLYKKSPKNYKNS